MGVVPYRKPPNFIERILLNFTFRQKITLITILISFATIFVTYLFMSSQITKIDFTEKEIAGNQYQIKFHQIYNDLIKYRIAATTKGSFASSIDDKLLTDNFKQFLLLDDSLGKELITDDLNLQIHGKSDISPKKLFNTWISIETASSSNPIADHNDLITELQNLLLYIGDSSNMTYDPEVETSYLMEITIRSLPKEQDLISQIIISGENFTSKESLTSEEKLKLTTLVSLLQASVQTTESSINKSLSDENNANKHFENSSVITDPMKRYKDAVKNLTSFVASQVIDASAVKTSDNLTTKLLIEKLDQLGRHALATNDHLWSTLTSELNRLLNQRLSSIRTTGYTLIGVLIFCFGLSALLGYFAMSEADFFFRTVHKAVDKFANGDLTSRAPVTYDKSFDMMRQVLNELGDSIEDLIEQLHKSGVQLTSTTTQIAAAAKHQEGTVCQQGATVKQILITAGEISATAKDFAKTMDQVSKSAEQTSHLAASGKNGLTQMETIMRQMVTASKNIASKLAVLNEKANAITSVITTITKVADQTNLLSLNASIEAEKAGEHGKSFAVIAREIRRLADQTANATLDIEKMITEMMSAVSEGVMGVEKFIEEIRSGVGQVSTVSEQLSQIIERVQHQTASYESVNKGVQAQSLGAEQINESIMQLSDAAQETTKSIRQFHNAIEQLNVATKGMQVSVSRIKK